MGISKYIDLRIPSQPSFPNDVNKVECECCGLSEDCTRAYVQLVRARFFGKWVCGLCSEVVNEGSQKLGRKEALHSHMEACKMFNGTIRLNPAMSLASAMTHILKKCSRKKR